MIATRPIILTFAALLLAAPAFAQKMDTKAMPALPAAKMSSSKMNTKMSGTMKDTKMPEEKMAGNMMGAPVFKYSAKPMMNMMMMGNTVEFTKAPGYKLVSYTYNMHSATLTYSGKSAESLFKFYSKAIMSEGWKEDMNMKMGKMAMGQYGEAYVMKNWKLDLMTMNKGNQTMVTLKTH